MRRLCMILLALAFATADFAAIGPVAMAVSGKASFTAPIELAQRRKARGDVYLLRGGMGSVFSRGMDELAGDLKKQGIPAKVVSHRQWRTVLSEIEDNRPKRGRRPVILIGHSLGANRAIDIARQLNEKKIRVDYVVSFAATAPRPVPRNIRRATNFYFEKGGWGKPLVKGRGFRGRLSNVDYSGKRGIDHFNIDEDQSLHRQIVNRVLRIFGRSRRAELPRAVSPSAG